MIAHLGFDYHYRPEDVANGTNTIMLDEALRALALLQNDPRYAAWLKSEPTRLANPDSSEYRTLFTVALSGVAVITLSCATARFAPSWWITSRRLRRVARSAGFIGTVFTSSQRS